MVETVDEYSSGNMLYHVRDLLILEFVIMVALDTTSKMSFALEGTPETDPIGAGGLNWRFGVMTYNMQLEHPTAIKQWEPLYKSDQRNPYDTQLLKSFIQSGVAYYPVNGAALYLLLGQSSTAGDPEAHTMTNIDTGTQPTFTARSELAGGDVAKYFSASGCKVSSLSNMIDLSGNFPYLSETLTFDAIKTNDPPTYDGVVARFYPTNDGTITGTQRTDRYKKDANTVFTWHSVDYLPYLQHFNCMLRANHILGHVENQAELEYINEGKYSFGFSFTLLRGADQTVWEDFNAETQDDLVFKIYNTATRYRQITFTNCSLITCKAPHSEDHNMKTWLVQGMAEDQTSIVVDEIDKTVYYGD